MKNRKTTITHSNMPTKFPVPITILVWLLLDRLQVSELMWGISYAVAAILWIAIIITFFTEDRKDVFDKS